MSFSREVKDFTEGFQQGYKIWSDADTRREAQEYHNKLYAHWDADSKTKALAGKAADQAAIDAAGKLRERDVSTDLGGGTGGGGGNKPQLTPDILNDPDKMRSFIHQAESKGNYNATVYMANGKPGPTANLTDMTLEQVQAYQKDMIANGHASTAVGAGQYIAPTLNGLINTLGLDPKTTKFTPEVQDKLTDELLRQRGYDSYKAGKMDAPRFLTNLSYEWASLPNPHTGRSSYAGTAGNASTVGYGSSVFATAPTPMAGARAESGRPLGQSTTAEAGASTPTPVVRATPPAAQPSGTSAKPPVVQPAPAIAPSMATPDTGTTSTPRADLDPSQIPVPPSVQASAPGAAAIPPSTSPVELASAVSPWAIPGYPNPMAQFAGGGLVTPQPQGSRHDSGSQVAESVPPPHGLTVYATGGNVMPPQLQGSVQESLPGYAMGGEVEPGTEDTEGDTSPIPNFDPNTPVEVRGYDGKFTAAQAAAAAEGDDSTPGTDEYWAAARRQQASLQPPAPAVPPHQDPQLTASRPAGQAIPVTGATAPGDTGQPTSFFDFIGKAIGGIADAVHAGLMGLGKMLGLSSAIPSGAPADPAAVQKLASGEGVKYSAEEVKGIDKAVGIPDTLAPGLKNIARLSAGYDYYKQKGDMASANKYAGSMLATIQDTVRMKGAQALLAGKHGDYAMMAKKLQEGHDEFPDGNVMKVSEVSGEGATYEIIGPDGRVSQSGRATIDDMMKLATGMSNGTEFFKQAGYLGGKSTPQQIAKDKSDAALEEYTKAPGAMTAQDQAWRASKSPEQLAAIDKMDWKDREVLKTKELQGQKQTSDEQNQQEASRLMGLEQEAKNEIAAAQAQRPNRFVQTNDEKAAWDKLAGVQKAIHGWAAASPGRWQYLRPLEGGVTSSGKSTGVGVTTPGAIPPAGGGRQTPKQAQEAQDDAEQYAKDQAERVGTLQQEQFSDEGKPRGGTRAKTRADYQQVLQGQRVQKAYDESGAAKAPKKADLEKITGEVDQQYPDLKDEQYDGLKQRFGQAASVFMNNNDVTAKQAVGVVKAITELGPDGKPKAEMSFTDDGRVKVAGYSPMILDRETLGLLGNLSVAHAKAQGTNPQLGSATPGQPAPTLSPLEQMTGKRAAAQTVDVAAGATGDTGASPAAPAAGAAGTAAIPPSPYGQSPGTPADTYAGLNPVRASYYRSRGLGPDGKPLSPQRAVAVPSAPAAAGTQDKQNQGYVSDIGAEARSQSKRSGAGEPARKEDEQETKRLATKGSMRAEAARRAAEAARTLKARRVAIPVAGS